MSEAAPENEFRSELKALLNKHNIEGASNTPDHVLTDYLIRCLDNFTETTQNREAWYGVKLKPGEVRDYLGIQSGMGSETSGEGNN